MPLTMAPLGEERMIIKITGRDTVQKHLANLGFVTGGNVTVISEMGGKFSVGVRSGLEQELACADRDQSYRFTVLFRAWGYIYHACRVVDIQ